jgi:hypothetical protein
MADRKGTTDADPLDEERIRGVGDEEADEDFEDSDDLDDTDEEVAQEGTF